MALSIGGHLGPYEIVAPIGADGMGEVYRARGSIARLPSKLSEFRLRSFFLASAYDNAGFRGAGAWLTSTASVAPLRRKALHSIYDRVQRSAGPHRRGTLSVVREIVAPDVHWF